MVETRPVILGSSLSGLLVSQSLSRAGIPHILVGDGVEPAEIPRLGESLNDTASPELWRLYGQEFGEWFFTKNHISYFNGNFSTLIHLANPRRRERRVAKFARTDGSVPRYPWFGEGLFHLDRIGFDKAIFHKVRADKLCDFIVARVDKLDYDAASDAVTALHLSNGSTIEQPRYVFDNTGYKSLCAEAASVGVKTLGPPQRVIFTHYRRPEREMEPAEWWRYGTNLVRPDKEFDGFDAIAWVIPIGRTLSVGMSIDLKGPLGDEDSETLMARLDEACKRRGLDYRPIYPEMLPVQNLRHSYFFRDRAYGKNWLLVGGSFGTIWFPSSSGLWTTTAAAGMAPDLVNKPELGKFYDQRMRGLVPFHNLLDRVAHGPRWRSSFDVYRFYCVGMTYICGRVATYLRIKNKDYYGWFRPGNWILAVLSLIGYLVPALFLLIGGFALVRCRLETDRSRQARSHPLYFWPIPFRVWNFVRSIPDMLWSLVPRRVQPQLSAPQSPTRKAA